jgi:membrane-bound inhibitor of C-type lysozyme
MRNLTLSLIALAALAACGTSAPAPINYTCGAYKVSVDTVANTATLHKPAGAIVLPKATAAIGERYADESKGKKWPIVWTKEGKTTLWVKKKAYDCK